MTEEENARLERIEAQMRALTNLMLSHIVASDALVRGLAQETVEQATIQRDAALHGGQGLSAVHLNVLLDDIRTACDLPPES